MLERTAWGFSACVRARPLNFDRGALWRDSITDTHIGRAYCRGQGVAALAELSWMNMKFYLNFDRFLQGFLKGKFIISVPMLEMYIIFTHVKACIHMIMLNYIILLIIYFLYVSYVCVAPCLSGSWHNRFLFFGFDSHLELTNKI